MAAPLFDPLVFDNVVFDDTTAADTFDGGVFDLVVFDTGGVASTDFSSATTNGADILSAAVNTGGQPHPPATGGSSRPFTWVQHTPMHRPRSRKRRQQDILFLGR